MPPIPEKKPDPANTGTDTPRSPVDIKSVLLPKKESGPNVDSAQRINAGALLAQEQSATLPIPAPRPAPKSAPAAPIVVVEETSTRPLQTYRSDVEKIVHEGGGVSVVSIAAAEAERRGKEPHEAQSPEEKAARQRSWAMTTGGILLVVLAATVLAVVLLRPTSVQIPELPKAPLITVDDVMLVPIPATLETRDAIVTTLLAARQQVKLSLGLVEWLYVAEPATTTGASSRQLSITELLQKVAPQAPAEMLRTLDGTYLLGVHSFDENQPFLLLHVDSYETAYHGMIVWERTLQDDLAPLFNRNPSPRLGNQAQAPASSTPQFLQTAFVDKIIDNRDTRVVQNGAGDILLLWTFLGRNTVLIATNEYTLREVLSRLNTAPVVPNPGK